MGVQKYQIPKSIDSQNYEQYSAPEQARQTSYNLNIIEQMQRKGKLGNTNENENVNDSELEDPKLPNLLQKKIKDRHGAKTPNYSPNRKRPSSK